MKKVMVVDDDKEFLEETAVLLNNNGYEPITLNNSRDVFMKAWLENVDLILMDLKIDNKSGFQLADELKRSEKTCNIPIIAITGYYTREEQLAVMKICGFAKRFTKPVNPSEIIEAVKKYA